MTRPIKFRVRVRSKRDGFCAGFDYWTLKELLHAKANYGDGNDFEVGSVDESTGLTDRNGVEIWEGDIIKTTFGVHAVEFDGGKFGVYVEKTIRLLDDYDTIIEHIEIQHGPEVEDGGVKEVVVLEVLGNVHEHPHLLEEK